MNKSMLVLLLVLVQAAPALAAGGAGASPVGGAVSRAGSGAPSGWTVPHSSAGLGLGISPAHDVWTHTQNAPVPDRNHRFHRSPTYAFDRIPRCDVILDPSLVYPIANWPSGQFCGTRVFVGSSIYATPRLPGAEGTMFPLTVEY